MKKLHMIIQGKGGVGKSLISSLLAQHFAANGVSPICIDTDPVNATFAGYQAFDVKRIELMTGDDIDPRAFDEMIELVMAADDESVIVVDNGASSFVPLCSWMIENDATTFLREADIKLVLHSVITGGQAHGDTVLGFSNLLNHFDVPLVVWLNEYYGKIEYNGRPFENSVIIQNNQERIHAFIRIAAVNPKTFGYDFANALCDKKTFEEAITDPSISIMARQRLKMMWRELNAQISNANL
jgi:hypothetical protein